MNETQQLVNAITEGIQDKKGKNIVVADLTNIGDTICKYFIICQGNSPSQVQDIIVHVFLPQTRDFYDIEHLWADAQLTSLPDID